MAAIGLGSGGKQILNIHPSIHPHDWNVGMKLIFTGEEYGDRYAARTLLLNIQIIIEVCIVPENALFQKKH